MPTLPSPDPATGTHAVREVAEGFGADAGRYDRARPRYPQDVVRRIGGAGLGVLDVGCGTGILSRQLLDAGCRVLGVDVDPRMAEIARRHGVEVEVGAFETWDAAGRTFDAVAAAQTWHWVDPDAGAARAARVLCPGGRLALVWNAGQHPLPLATAFAEVYARVVPQLRLPAPGRPVVTAYEAMAATAAAGIRGTGDFGEPEEWRSAWTHDYTREAWLDLVPTQGGHHLLAPDRLAELLDALGAALDAHGGGFTMDYTTVVVTAVRRQGSSATT